MSVGYVAERKYISVTLLFQDRNGEGRALDASSGIYVLDGDEEDNGNYIVSVVEEKIALEQITVRYTCAELIHKTKVRWINIPVDCIRVEELVSEDLGLFFNMCSYEGSRARYTIVCRLPPFCTIRNELRPFELLRGQQAIRGRVPSQIRIESSPFGLTTVDIFNGYTSYGYVNYESQHAEFWLSDCKYMDNMNGGIVMLGGEAQMDRCIGLVWGNIKWKGHGELMIIVGWDTLLAQTGLFAPHEESNPPAGADTSATGEARNKVVGLQVTDRYGVVSWGSGVVVDRGTVMTNKHVVTGSSTNNRLPESIEIMYSGRQAGVSRIAAPKLGVDVYMSLQSNDHDVCFLRCRDTAFCAAVDEGIEVLGGGRLAAFAERRSTHTETLLRVGDPTVSIGHGLFLHHERPLQSAGRVTQIHGACETVISSSPCWAGCSGGALVTPRGELVALMASNVRHLASGEVLEQVNLAIGLPLLSVCHRALVVPRQPRCRSRSAAAATAKARL